LVALLAGALSPPVSADSDWFGRFCDRVVSEGKASTLPPHLSLVLGLGDGVQPVPVKQAGKRDGHEVRTFSVVQLERKRSVVLMDYDEGTQQMNAFLLRSNGKLERAVTYKGGASAQPLAAAQARAGHQQQLQYWAHEAGSLPPPAAPSR